MFYFMSKCDFMRVSVIVEVINQNHLTTRASKKVLGWINNCENEVFDQFCLAVAEEWCDSYPSVAINDYAKIARIIEDVLIEW